MPAATAPGAPEQKINNLVFSGAPRVHVPRPVMPGQKYNKSKKVVEYSSLPGVIELWIFNVDGWDIYDFIRREPV